MITKRYTYALTFAGALAFAMPTFAQKPAGAPANATAQCADGTYSTAKTQKGACSRHGGVKTWWGAAETRSTATPKGGETAAKTRTRRAAGAASIPAGATGQCADGTYTKAKTQRGACSTHGGVKSWFAETPAEAAPAPTAPAPAAPAPTSRPAPPTTPRSVPAQPKTTTPAAGVPAGATARCKDGTYSFSKTHTGACSHHGGVAEWYK
jgi:hypothetical protein